MTKRPEENDIPDMEAGMTTAERRRRRRRGAGLRVPSDNVPRRPGHPSVAPVPEDPDLAVSIAYSFASDASGQLPRDELEAEISAADATPVPIDDEETSVASEDGVDAAWASDRAETSASDDGGFDTKTREMPVMQLEALGLSLRDTTPAAPPVDVDGSVDIELEVADDTTGERATPVPEPARRAPMPRASTVALSDDDLEELAEVDGAGLRAGLPRMPVRSAGMPPVRSAEKTPTPRVERVPTPAPVPAAAAARTETSAVVELEDDDLDGEVLGATDAADSGEILTET